MYLLRVVRICTGIGSSKGPASFFGLMQKTVIHMR